MTTIAAIARIVSAHVGVAAVERWAEALHATDMLPGLDEAVGPESAATLLLAVMAALTPDQASAAVATLRGARQTACRCGTGVDGETDAAWRDVAPGFPDHTVFDHLCAAICDDGLSTASIARISVAAPCTRPSPPSTRHR